MALLQVESGSEGLDKLPNEYSIVIFSEKPFWVLLGLWPKVPRTQAKRCEIGFKELVILNFLREYALTLALSQRER